MKSLTSKRIASILLCLCLAGMTCTSCSSLKANQDLQFLQQLEQTITQTQSLLNDSMSIAGEMATETYGLVPPIMPVSAEPMPASLIRRPGTSGS